MSLKDAKISPSERFLARRRRTFLRDWILALIALGLAAATGLFLPEGDWATRGQSGAEAPLVR